MNKIQELLEKRAQAWMPPEISRNPPRHGQVSSPQRMETYNKMEKNVQALGDNRASDPSGGYRCATRADLHHRAGAVGADKKPTSCFQRVQGGLRPRPSRQDHAHNVMSEGIDADGSPNAEEFEHQIIHGLDEFNIIVPSPKLHHHLCRA